MRERDGVPAVVLVEVFLADGDLCVKWIGNGMLGPDWFRNDKHAGFRHSNRHCTHDFRLVRIPVHSLPSLS